MRRWCLKFKKHLQRLQTLYHRTGGVMTMIIKGFVGKKMVEAMYAEGEMRYGV
jgi:hypothetical protein